MCGITGILRWGKRPADGQEIEAMTRAVAHRGPDGEGLLRRDGIALGHRRLSIIDLEGGKQPMSNEDGQVWVTFNGEIYNYRALRTELEAAGHRFSTRSDTEVLVHAWEQWQEECLGRLRGMFAFAIADFGRGVLFLARDHFGIKPLFYRRGRDYLAFASVRRRQSAVRPPGHDRPLSAVPLHPQPEHDLPRRVSTVAGLLPANVLRRPRRRTGLLLVDAVRAGRR
jgi:asparagine synthase (glutamine-hydrolysing)